MAATRKILPGEELPEEKVKVYLAKTGLIRDVNSAMESLQFSSGFSNLTYLLKIEGRELVLRRPPAGAVKRGHDMSREYRVLSQLQPHFPKVPQTYAYSGDAAILGAPFYLMEKVEGIILTKQEVKARSILPADFATIAESWLETFVELHQLDYQAIGLGEFGHPEGYVERQVRNWSQQYLKAATEEIASAGKVMSWMETHQPREYGFSLIHNDYKYDNVVFSDDSWTRIRAVLDWEMSTLGDPLMDLGTSLGYWVTENDPEMMKAVSLSPTTLPGNPGRMDVVEQYARKSGRQINHLTFYYVFGLFKIAVIVQQIFYRYKKGFTQDPRFARLGQLTRVLCDTAWQAAQKDRIDNLY